MNKVASWLFNNDKGERVIAQAPNWPIIVALGLVIARQYLGSYPDVKSFVWSLSAVTMLYWSYLEISSGSSYFRRMLGVLVGLASLYALYDEINIK